MVWGDVISFQLFKEVKSAGLVETLREKQALVLSAERGDDT